MTLRIGVRTIYLHDILFMLWSLAIILPLAPPVFAQIAGLTQFILLSLFAFAHGVRCYGAKRMAWVTAILVLIANAMENLSINTGFPFGWFDHQPAMGPKIFDVPILVNFGYLAIGYVSIFVADTILGRMPTGHKYTGLVGIAVIAGFIAAGWNAALDPLGSTLQRSWIWRDGGGYFGVPITNTLGWLLTMTVAAALAASALKSAAHTLPHDGAMIWLSQPPCVLLLQTLSLIVGWLHVPRGPVTDPTGQTWPIAALMETSALVSIVTCGAFGTVGLLRAWQLALCADNGDRPARSTTSEQDNR